jgi:hypothetical protein
MFNPIYAETHRQELLRQAEQQRIHQQLLVEARAAHNHLISVDFDGNTEPIAVPTIRFNTPRLRKFAPAGKA